MGYISSVAQQLMPGRNDRHFDINVKKGQSESKRIRLKKNAQTKKNLFLRKHEVKSPLKFTLLHSTI